MPMVTESDPSRRRWLLQMSALTGSVLLAGPAWAGIRAAGRLLSAWDDAAGRHFVGLLDIQDDGISIAASIEVPTRAHDLLVEADGSILAAARRPGIWMLRWTPFGKPRASAAQWLWAEPDRCFTGHLALSSARRWLYSTETDLESGGGLLVRRDIRTLERDAEWALPGIDPHQMLVGDDGQLLLALGGVPLKPEAGRIRGDLEKMDSSLVRIDQDHGGVIGQWRLPDRRLSIRHLARHSGGTVGVALQAEHDEAERKAAAPVLALFDGTRLRSFAAPQPLNGYGGSIVAGTDCFAVSCPRAQGVGFFSPAGQWAGFQPLPEACPLAATGDGLWMGGSRNLALKAGSDIVALPPVSGLRLDNHWTRWQMAAGNVNDG